MIQHAGRMDLRMFPPGTRREPYGRAGDFARL